MIKRLLITLCFSILLCTSCNFNSNSLTKDDEDTFNIGRYKTEYIVFWNSNNIDFFNIYTNDSVYVCSFQGTNYLLEQNNKEELFSTTAPIKIKQCFKIK